MERKRLLCLLGSGFGYGPACLCSIKANFQESILLLLQLRGLAFEETLLVQNNLFFFKFLHLPYKLASVFVLLD